MMNREAKREAALLNSKVNAFKKVLKKEKIFLPEAAIRNVAAALDVDKHYDIRMIGRPDVAQSRLRLTNWKVYYKKSSLIQRGMLEMAQVVFGDISAFGCGFNRTYNGNDPRDVRLLDDDIDGEVERRLGDDWLNKAVDDGEISVSWQPEFDPTTPYVVIFDQKHWEEDKVYDTHEIVVYFPDPSRLH